MPAVRPAPLSLCVIALLALLTPFTVLSRAAADDPARASPAQRGSHLGLLVRDIAHVGCVVSWIEPGPLLGRGIESPTLARPDLLVTVDGVPASSASLAAALAKKAPGASIELVFRRALQRGPNFPTVAAHAEALETLTVTLDDAAAWTGTWNQPVLPAHPWPLPDAAQKYAPLESALAAEPEARAALERMQQAQRAMSAAQPDARRLARVTAALEQPLMLPAIAAASAAPARTLAVQRPFRCAAMLAAEHLDAELPAFDGHGSMPVPDSQGGIFALDFLLNEGRLLMQEALGDVYANPEFARDAMAVARGMRESLLVQGDGARKSLAVVRRGAEIDMNQLVLAIAHLDVDLALAPDLAAGEVETLREELVGAVEGDVLSTELRAGVGWTVVGGLGPNRYDMSKIAAVLDVGGDDTYTMSDLALGMRAIIDLAGDDRYEGGAQQGMASGVCGLFLIDDRAGNDRYIGTSLHGGSACFGVGLLIDRAGNDVYEGTDWTFGAACWGAGIVIDMSGHDSVRSEYLSQGCGGPRGFGGLIDVAGNDLYDAEGSQPSHYGTPAVCASFSQGVGVGIRRTAAGGIGLLADLAGDDRYRAGEFAQGGGYFFALGLLVDDAGNDRYWGNRYGQGWGAHQAAGALIDGGGDDTYVGMTGANQGAAWDQSVGLLLDASGNDSYQADVLAQGAAAQQAVALLIDLQGEDRYVAAPGGEDVAAQGHSGPNEYHFDRPAPIGGTYSWSLLLDLGGQRDHFSTGRPLNTTMKLGTVNSNTPARSTLNGLFIDAPADIDRVAPTAQPPRQ